MNKITPCGSGVLGYAVVRSNPQIGAVATTKLYFLPMQHDQPGQQGTLSQRCPQSSTVLSLHQMEYVFLGLPFLTLLWHRHTSRLVHIWLPAPTQLLGCGEIRVTSQPLSAVTLNSALQGSMMLSYLFFSALNRQPHTHVNSSKTKLIKCLDECPGPPPDAGCVIFFFFPLRSLFWAKLNCFFSVLWWHFVHADGFAFVTAPFVAPLSP